MRTGASSCRMRSRAARPPCCGSLQDSRGIAAGRSRICRSRACREGSARSRISSTAVRRRRCGWSASRERTARRRARTGSATRSMRADAAQESWARWATAWSARWRRRRTRRRTLPHCTSSCSSFAARVRRPWRWKSRRTGWSRGASAASSSTSRLFTNLTRDHLDYHHTMAAYGAAKAKLFTSPGLRTAVINADDPFGQSLIDGVRARGTRLLTYGLAAGDIAASEIRMSGNGIALAVNTPWGKAEFASPMIGNFNAQNLLGVLGVLLASDVPIDVATAALARLAAPGRPHAAPGWHRPAAGHRRLRAHAGCAGEGADGIAARGCRRRAN